MKKYISIMLTVLLCFCLCACTADKEKEEETSAVTTTEQQTTEKPLPKESTTKEPSSDVKKGNSLKGSVEKVLGNGELSGDFDYGRFTFVNNRDAQAVYAFERSEELEKKASDNAQKLVDEIRSYYGGEITLYSNTAQQIGNGENGIDSVRYKFYYVNAQNQILTIYADSDGVISYADCAFTW